MKKRQPVSIGLILIARHIFARINTCPSHALRFVGLSIKCHVTLIPHSGCSWGTPPNWGNMRKLVSPKTNKTEEIALQVEPNKHQVGLKLSIPPTEGQLYKASGNSAIEIYD